MGEETGKIHPWLRKKLISYYGDQIVITKPSAGVYASRKGTSDFICCIKGRYVAIEVKVIDKDPTDLQADFLTNVTTAGGIALCMRGKDPNICAKIDALL